jgi:hypothetical protein
MTLQIRIFIFVPWLKMAVIAEIFVHIHCEKNLFVLASLPLLIPGHFSRHPYIFFTFPHVRKLFRSLEGDLLRSQMLEKSSCPWNETFYIPPCHKNLVPGGIPGLGTRIFWHGGM